MKAKSGGMSLPPPGPSIRTGVDRAKRAPRCRRLGSASDSGAPRGEWMNLPQDLIIRSTAREGFRSLLPSARCLPRKALRRSFAIRISTGPRSKLAATVWSKRLRSFWKALPSTAPSATKSRPHILVKVKKSRSILTGGPCSPRDYGIMREFPILQCLSDLETSSRSGRQLPMRNSGQRRASERVHIGEISARGTVH